MAIETKKEVRESWKTPTVMGSIAAVILVFFGILGKSEIVSFELKLGTYFMTIENKID
jgi:hypothetical protein